MKVSAISTTSQLIPKTQKRLSKRTEVPFNKAANVSFASLKTAGKGALAGGVFGALLFATAGAALPFIAVFAAEEAILGAVLGHAAEKAGIIEDDDKK